MLLDAWNDSKLQLVPASEAPPLDTMKRLDSVAIFAPYRTQLEAMRDTIETLNVTSADQEEEMKLAAEIKGIVAKIRTSVWDHTRVEMVSEMKRAAKAIDLEAGKIRDTCKAWEARLEKMATFKQRQLADARMRLQQEREDILKPWVDNVFSMDLADLPEDVFNRVRDSYEADFYAKQDRERKERLAAEEAERARNLEVQRLTNELAQAETERLRVAEVARVETARLQALADAAKLDADILRKAQERLLNARQTAQQGTDAQKLESIAQRLGNPQWPEMSEPWAYDIIHDEHVRLTLAGLAVWIRGQVKEHQPNL